MTTKEAKGRTENPTRYLHPNSGITAQAKKAKNRAPKAQKNDKVITARPLT